MATLVVLAAAGCGVVATRVGRLLYDQLGDVPKVQRSFNVDAEAAQHAVLLIKAVLARALEAQGFLEKEVLPHMWPLEFEEGRTFSDYGISSELVEEFYLCVADGDSSELLDEDGTDGLHPSTSAPYAELGKDDRTALMTALVDCATRPGSKAPGGATQEACYALDLMRELKLGKIARMSKSQLNTFCSKKLGRVGLPKEVLEAARKHVRAFHSKAKNYNKRRLTKLAKYALFAVGAGVAVAFRGAYEDYMGRHYFNAVGALVCAVAYSVAGFVADSLRVLKVLLDDIAGSCRSVATSKGSNPLARLVAGVAWIAFSLVKLPLDVVCFLCAGAGLVVEGNIKQFEFDKLLVDNDGGAKAVLQRSPVDGE